jgi:hypothetical protein
MFSFCLLPYLMVWAIDVVDPIPIEIDETMLDWEELWRYVKGHALHKPV